MSAGRAHRSTHSARRSLAATLLCALLVGAVLLVPPVIGSVGSSPTLAPAAAAAAANGTIVGRAVGSDGMGVSRIKVMLFDSSWTYLRAGSVTRSGKFEFRNLPAGLYRLQLVDRRPRYDVKSFASSDVSVRVYPGRASAKNVTMRRGAFITGKVTVGKRGTKAGRNAKVAVADRNGRSYEVQANSRGEFALGGLPSGSFTLWAWDAKKQWVDRPINVAKVKHGSGRDVRVKLRKRAGGYHGFLFAGPNPVRGTVWATAVSKKTGQWWPFPIRNGDLSVRGLMPGSYRIEVPGAGRYLGGTFHIRVPVRAKRSRAINIRLTTLGGWFSGRAVSSEGGGPLSGMHVSVYDRYGKLLTQVRTDRNGVFRAGGTIWDQGGLTVVVEAYSTIAGRTYKQRYVRSGLSVVRGRATNLGTLAFTPQPLPPKPTPTSTAPTTAPPTTAPPTSAPPTSTPPTTGPSTPTVTVTVTVPPTTAPPTTAPPTTAPPTSVPPTATVTVTVTGAP
ncbi:hypothetical protein KG112_02910 [Nocardioides sp. zg-ZUI104]|uniref:MSCRAMM family protein n=1 Tax=Nocardioides faecalis TaxID=2803858 RepID=UPI001BCF540E|nr:hypothetical protein [Nocardioides faecalis]MBS4751758.1 hypothetical protein [Nocardioides faecalis]